MGESHCKKVHNFHMDSQTLLGPIGKKGAWQWEWPVTKGCITSRQTHVTWPNFKEYTRKHFHWSCLAPPLQFSPTPSITHKLFVVGCWSQLLQICICFLRSGGETPYYQLTIQSLGASKPKPFRVWNCRLSRGVHHIHIHISKSKSKRVLLLSH